MLSPKNLEDIVYQSMYIGSNPKINGLPINTFSFFSDPSFSDSNYLSYKNQTTGTRSSEDIDQCINVLNKHAISFSWISDDEDEKTKNSLISRNFKFSYSFSSLVFSNATEMTESHSEISIHTISPSEALMYKDLIAHEL